MSDISDDMERRNRGVGDGLDDGLDDDDDLDDDEFDDDDDDDEDDDEDDDDLDDDLEDELDEDEPLGEDLPLEGTTPPTASGVEKICPMTSCRSGEAARIGDLRVAGASRNEPRHDANRPCLPR